MKTNLNLNQVFNKYLYSSPLAVIISLVNIIFLVLIFFTIIFIFSPNNIESTEEFSAEDLKISAQFIAEKCPPFNRKEDCYKTEFTKLVKEKGLLYSQDTLYALQDTDKYLNHCHVLSHYISGVAIKLDPSSWKELANEVDVTTCGAGFFHGILEARIGYDQNFKITKDSIDEICNQGKRDFKESTCNHILGHLLLLENEGNIDPSLPVCNALDNPTYQRECLNGIFMEESFKPMLVEHGLAEIPVRDKKRMDKQEKRCLNYSGIEAQSCWIDMAEIYSEYYNYDSEKVLKSCDIAPVLESKKQCYKKAIVHFSVSPNYDSAEKLLGICIPYNDSETEYKNCLSIIIHTQMYYSVKFTDRSITLCNNVEEKYKNYCFKDLGDYLKLNVPNRSDRLELCANTPPDYINLCAN